MEKELVCVAQFLAKEEMIEDLKNAFLTLIPLTHAEEGCIRYELNQALENNRKFTFVEKFRDREAFDFHCNTDYIKGFFKDIDLYVDWQDVTTFEEIKTK